MSGGQPSILRQQFATTQSSWKDMICKQRGVCGGSKHRQKSVMIEIVLHCTLLVTSLSPSVHTGCLEGQCEWAWTTWVSFRSLFYKGALSNMPYFVIDSLHPIVKGTVFFLNIHRQSEHFREVPCNRTWMETKVCVWLSCTSS